MTINASNLDIPDKSDLSYMSDKEGEEGGKHDS